MSRQLININAYLADYLASLEMVLNVLLSNLYFHHKLVRYLFILCHGIC